MNSQITPQRFDRGIAKPKSNIIWTLPAIGDRIGCSRDFVIKNLLDAPGSPIKKVGRRHCAVEDDLLDFFRTRNFDPR